VGDKRDLYKTEKKKGKACSSPLDGMEESGDEQWLVQLLSSSEYSIDIYQTHAFFYQVAYDWCIPLEFFVY
jgi:hypothetical protein